MLEEICGWDSSCEANVIPQSNMYVQITVQHMESTARGESFQEPELASVSAIITEGLQSLPCTPMWFAYYALPTRTERNIYYIVRGTTAGIMTAGLKYSQSIMYSTCRSQ